MRRRKKRRPKKISDRRQNGITKKHLNIRKRVSHRWLFDENPQNIRGSSQSNKDMSLRFSSSNKVSKVP